MISEHDEGSTNDSEEDESCKDVNENTSDDGTEYLDSDKYFQSRLDYEAIGQKYEIEPHQLLRIKPLGQGYYSDVHMGMLSLPTVKIPVAVKTPKTITGSINAAESEEILRRQREALRAELNIFIHLQSSSSGGHENVLKLVGAISTIKSDFCLLTEYCECGSMDLFLQKKWKDGKFENELNLEDNESDEVWKIQHDPSWGETFQARRNNGIITTSDLLWFALQIARAMQFLTDKKVLHRDVALRNILLKSDFSIKVADFGLSKKLKEREDQYYVWNTVTPLPIRYIAPESLKSGRSSITSEYWSFGVVIWELFTFAEKQPYSVEFENYDSKQKFHDFLFEYLSSGYRISIPDIVPKLIKDLLSKLWDSDPKERPSFQASKNVIEQALLQSCPNMLKGETAPVHSSGYAVYNIGYGVSSIGSIKNRDCATFVSHTSPYPIGKTISRKNLAIWMRQKIGRTVISVGILIAILTATAIVLGTQWVGKTPIPAEACMNELDTKDIEQLREAAEQGNGQAQASLGKLLDSRKYYEEAIKCYRKASEKGDIEAQFRLGWMYEEGHGVNQSYEEAVKWYKNAAEHGHATAQLNLAIRYENGPGINQSDEEAVKWYRKAAEKNNTDAQFRLGWMYEKGHGINQSYEEAVKWYAKAAEQGYSRAQYNLGNMYYKGEGVDQSYEEAVKWYKNAAEQDNIPLAQYNLGIMYEKGQEINKSSEEAVKWYKKAAEREIPLAQFSLGNLYYKGEGVNRSYEEAVKWWKKAALLGIPLAHLNVGWMYEKGRGVDQSYKEAVKWYTNVAEQGIPLAQYHLGIMYEKGLGVDRSYQEAVKWYTKAAEQGILLAQYYLGNLYYKGEGVDKSYKDAVKWYKRAADQGHFDARLMLQRKELRDYQ